MSVSTVSPCEVLISQLRLSMRFMKHVVSDCINKFIASSLSFTKVCKETKSANVIGDLRVIGIHLKQF